MKIIVVFVLLMMSIVAEQYHAVAAVREQFGSIFLQLCVLHRQTEQEIMQSFGALVDDPVLEEPGFWGVDIHHYGDMRDLKDELHRLFWTIHHAREEMNAYDDALYRSWNALFSEAMDVLRTELDNHAKIILKIAKMAEMQGVSHKLTRFVRIYARECQRECVGVLCY